MKRLLILSCLLWSVAHAQIPNYTTVNHRYKWLAGAMDGLNIPAGTTPALATNQWVRAGALYFDSTGGNKGVHYWDGSAWTRLADTTAVVTLTASNGLTRVTNDIQLGGTLGSSTTIAGASNALTFTGLASFNISSTPLITTVTSSNTSMTARQALTNDGGRLFLQTSGAFLGYDTSAGGFHNYLEIDPVWFHIHMDSQTDSLKIDNLNLKAAGWDSTDYKLMVNGLNIGAQFGGHTARVNWSDVANILGVGTQDLASVLTQGGISTVNTSMQVTNLTDFQFSATGDAGMTAGASLFVHATNDLNIGTNNTDGTTSHIKLRAADSIVFNQPNGVYYAYAVPHSLVATGKMLVWDSVGRTITARAIPTGGGLTVGTTTITSGTDTRVPFNDAGVYNEDAGLVYDKTTDKLTVGSTIGIEPASGSAVLSIKSSAGAFTTTFTYDASRNFISDYRDGNVIRVNGNNIGSWVSTGLSVNGGGGTAADFTVRSAGYNPFLFVDVSANAMGVGRGTPAAYLHLGAGTATAGTAPLMFTSGTNLTTAVAGTMEYNGTNLFFTRTGTTRESVITANAVNSVSPTSPNRTITVVIDGTTYYIHAKTTND